MRIIHLFISCTTIFSYGWALSSQDVLKSSARFYPEIIIQQQKIKQAEASLKEAEGAFDTVLSNESYTRTRGFYDGQLYDTRITQPLSDYNAQIYGGYRVADGVFPIYEDEYVTNNGGEYYLGAKLSLLQRRDIDQRRHKMAATTLKVVQEEVKQFQTLLKVQEKALTTYWDWVIKGSVYKLYQEIYQISLRRHNILKKRFKHGDIAKIYLTENQQYIAKRKGQMLQSEIDFTMVAQALGLYYRDVNGRMAPPTFADLPQSIQTNFKEAIPFNDVALLMMRRPEWQMLDNQKEMALNDKRLFENDLLPKADIDIKFADDRGGGSRVRDDSEMIMKLNFSVPLGRRAAKAKISRAKAILRQLDAQERLLSDRLRIQVEQSLIAIENMQNYIALIRQEEKMALFMTETENKRFKNGASDLFTLNQREEQVIQVSIRLMKAYNQYYKIQAKFYALTADKEKLEIL